MGRRLSVPIIGALVALLAVVLVAPGLDPVSGAIPNAGGSYSACLTKASGAVKVINYPKVKCAKGQRLLKWSQQGPSGPSGPAGPADWNAIGNKPAGFVDGIDDAGITGVRLTRVISATVDIPASGATPFPQRFSTVDCPAGSMVTGGGAVTNANGMSDIHTYMSFSYPQDRDTWVVGIVNQDTEPHQFWAYAMCIATDPQGSLTIAKKGVLPAKVQKAMKKRSR